MSVSEAKRKEGGIGETVRVIIHALIIAMLIRTFLFQPFNIPSGSMEKTLLVGDYLFVSKYTYGYSRFSLPFAHIIPYEALFQGRIWESKPQPGDVVVFRLPTDTSVDYIKRVIGTPGQRIETRQGVLHIDGQPIKRERIPGCADVGSDVKCWRETLPNGFTYTALDLVDNGFGDNMGPFVVPPGHYFMMGDNRDNSTDSRFPQVGYIPFENIIGRAQIIFFSLNEQAHPLQLWRWPSDVRWSRLFTLVR